MKQRRQCSYNLTLWDVRVNVAAIETQQGVPLVLMFQKCSLYQHPYQGGTAMLALHFRAVYAAANTMKRMETFTYSGRYSCLVLMNSGVARQNVVEVPNISFQEYPSSGIRVHTRG